MLKEMASRATREQAAAVIFALELSKQMKAWYQINRPSVKRVMPLFDRLEKVADEACVYYREQLELKDLVPIAKKVEAFNAQVVQKDYPAHVYIDFVDRMIAARIDKINNTERFCMVKKVLDATDDLCNYFDQRLMKNNLYHESKKMFQIWEATS